MFCIFGLYACLFALTALYHHAIRPGLVLFHLYRTCLQNEGNRSVNEWVGVYGDHWPEENTVEGF